jgi:hypothetical protein
MAYAKVFDGIGYFEAIGDVSMVKIVRIYGKARFGDGAKSPYRGASTAQC